MDANKNKKPMSSQIENYEEILEELYNDKSDRDNRVYWQ